ncbi:hypothetical protein ACFWWT_12715 [Streptomyces sp. NPDC058676]|uniref:hypothetical protein n=1 Tax=unclassified Streptomyces TaxID=2593676 RepID=UPI00364BD863
MNARTTTAALRAAGAATLLALTACTSGGDDDKATSPAPNTATTPKPPSTAATPSTDPSSAATAAGIPPEPIGAARVRLLRALAAANPQIVKYEDKAVDAARNQCGAINGGARRLDRSASQRFTYEDVTTTETQGRQINEALKGLGFCEV